MILDHYRKNLRATVGTSAGPYGYTLATWTTGATLINAQGVPSTLAVLAFMVGAVMGFLVVGVIAFGAVTQRFEQETGQPLILGSLHFFSVGGAIGVAALVAHYVDTFFAWPLAAFLYTTIYLLIVGAESTAAYAWDHREKG